MNRPQKSPTSEHEAALKPCPFCGGEAFLRQVGNNRTKSLSHNENNSRLTTYDDSGRAGVPWL